MNDSAPENLAEILRDSKQIQQALKAAVHDAVRTHKLLGQPIVTWLPLEDNGERRKNGRVSADQGTR